MKLVISSILLVLVPSYYHVLTKSLHHHGPSSSLGRQSSCRRLQSLGGSLSRGWARASSCGAAGAEAGEAAAGGAGEEECVLATVEVLRSCSRGAGADLDQACLDHLLEVGDS